jgi:hypothetical protein
MADRPILFSAPMVRALLAGTKTQTRRLFKGIEPMDNRRFHIFGGMIGVSEDDVPKHAPDYVRIQIGDRLWVRETWQGLSFGDYLPTKSSQCEVRYASTDPCADLDVEARGYPWRPSIFMPRWASRLTLTVADVRVERLQDISEDDAAAEGWPAPADRAKTGIAEIRDAYPIGWYAALWDSINSKPGTQWSANPWVVAYSFTVQHQNIDRIAA